MKKLLIAVSALAALTGSAFAADMAPAPYTKAPVFVPPAYNWTGFYISGGFGGGLWAADTSTIFNATGLPLTQNQRMGGSGWFGTVGAGYDWQFNGGWVAGILADGQFGSLSGSISTDRPSFLRTGGGVSTGTETLRNSYAAGVRLGYLVAPNVLSYVNGGYSGSQWSGAAYSLLIGGGPPLLSTPSFTRNGWFIGGGVENSLGFFGPGWFMKTEYRAAYYGTATLPETFIPTNTLTTFSETFKPWVQTVSTSLVYRFNWSGPVVAKY